MRKRVEQKSERIGEIRDVSPCNVSSNFQLDDMVPYWKVRAFCERLIRKGEIGMKRAPIYQFRFNEFLSSKSTLYYAAGSKYLCVNVPNFDVGVDPNIQSVWKNIISPVRIEFDELSTDQVWINGPTLIERPFNRFRVQTQPILYVAENTAAATITVQQRSTFFEFIAAPFKVHPHRKKLDVSIVIDPAGTGSVVIDLIPYVKEWIIEFATDYGADMNEYVSIRAFNALVSNSVEIIKKMLRSSVSYSGVWQYSYRVSGSFVRFEYKAGSGGSYLLARFREA